MAGAILPSGPETAGAGWSPDHLRLHRLLLRRPELLPAGACLLLAVSGGQDSMAMTGLLGDLRRRHGWRLQLWHGDHGWRPESGRQAAELAAWAAARGLPLTIERLADPQAPGNREAVARQWRYRCLARQARRLGCSHVLTAHTASDRAETVLLHLARGSHSRGLAALRSLQPLEALIGEPATAALQMRSGASHREAATGKPLAEPQAGGAGEAGWPGREHRSRRPGHSETGTWSTAAETPLLLVRPLQIFCRHDTARLCSQQGWPVWIDPGNTDAQLSRNRIRSQVLPVLEALHPGAARRISIQAERLAAELEQRQELLDLALSGLQRSDQQLDLDGLLRLSTANQAGLLQHWLRRQLGRELDDRSLQSLLPRLPRQRGPGRQDLAGGWQLRWQGSTLALLAPPEPPAPSHG